MIGPVSFADVVEVEIFDHDNDEKNANFSVCIEDLADWDSKPWALHGGLFMERALDTMLRIATPLDEVSAMLPSGGHGHEADRDPSRSTITHGIRGLQDGLHHGSALGNGDTGARPDGGVRLQGSTAAKDREAVLHTFGVKGGYMGRRSKRVSLEDLEDEGLLQAHARSMWNGEIEDEVRFFFPVPQPQPMEPVQRPQRFLLVDLLRMDDPMHEGKVPVLCDIYAWVNGQRNRRTIATLLSDSTTWHGIVSDLALTRVCRARFGNQCIIRVGWNLRLNDAPQQMRPDDLVTINYDHPEDEGDLVDFEAHYLLQVTHKLVHAGEEEQAPRDNTGSGDLQGTAVPTGSSPREDDSGEVERFFRDIQRVRQCQGTEEAEDPTQWTYFMFRRTNGYQRALLDPKDPFDERRQIAQVWEYLLKILLGSIQSEQDLMTYGNPDLWCI